MNEPKDIAKKLRRLSFEVVKEVEKVKLVPLLELNAKFQTRIFNKGINTSGGKIGGYSRNPMYVSIRAQKKRTGSQVNNSKLKAKGKNGKSKFKNGKVKRSRYFEQGYSEFRKAVGRQNQKVDLNLSGSLAGSIQVGARGTGGVLGFVSSDQRRLGQYQEERFGGDIFTVSTKEEQETIDLAEKLLIEAVEKLIDKI